MKFVPQPTVTLNNVGYCLRQKKGAANAISAHTHVVWFWFLVSAKLSVLVQDMEDVVAMEEGALQRDRAQCRDSQQALESLAKRRAQLREEIECIQEQRKQEGQLVKHTHTHTRISMCCLLNPWQKSQILKKSQNEGEKNLVLTKIHFFSFIYLFFKEAVCNF